MTDPLVTTFDILATSKATVAVELLVSAIDSKYSVIHDKAVGALLRRGTTRCQTEVIRRLSALTPVGRNLLEDQGTRLSGALRQALSYGDEPLRANALAIVGAMECYDQVPTLLEILEQRNDPFQPAVCQTLQELTNRLYEHLHAPAGRRPSDRFLRNLPQARQSVLTALEDACNRFDSLSYAHEVIECVLILGEPDHFAVRKVLLNSAPACRETAGNLLLNSKHPGVMRLIMEFMGENYPNAKAIEAFERRADPEFVFHVLRAFPPRLTDNQQKNFKQLTEIDWISDDLLPLEAIPPGLHEALVAFVQSTGMSVADKVEIQKWILLHGTMKARQAASQVLDKLAPDAIRGILFTSLDAEDEDIQAWATSQLRTQGVPEAIRLLVERLDSPLPAVRETAREELGSFNLNLMLNIFDHLDRGVCLKAGALVRKIDPECKQKLGEELSNPILRRRIRAARAAEALGLAREVQTGLLAMLADEDALARRTAAEALVAVPTPEVVARLTKLFDDDPSARVREAAKRSLVEFRRAGVKVGELQSAGSMPRREGSRG